MIRNTVINVDEHFYPLGNTPAVSLTQDLSPEQDADILLLGSGDARSILFTCFIDRARKLDITCCDSQVMIVARNILLFTLLFDDQEDEQSKLIWNIYYHWMLEDASARLLQEQVDKLLELSGSIESWRQCPYGSFIKFCDRRTLSKLQECWRGFKMTGLSSAQSTSKQSSFRANMERARRVRNHIHSGLNKTMSGLRSASPIFLPCLDAFNAVSGMWWEYGVISATLNAAEFKKLKLNPMFLHSPHRGLTIHYDIDPLVGFPLAVAFAPLQADSPLQTTEGAESDTARLVACAKAQFVEWAKAFRRSVANGSVFRFFNGDAIALALTIRNARSPAGSISLTSNLFCDSWSADALVLCEEDYQHASNAAPTVFDVIDTSNLVDHLGPINVLCVCADLLKPDVSSTLYTEVLTKKDASISDKLMTFLGCDARLIAFLLGLCPAEMYTNASNAAEADVIFDEAGKGISGLGGSGADIHGQLRSRLRWKKTVGQSSGGSHTSIVMKPETVARILIEMHEEMFHNENLAKMLQQVRLGSPVEMLRAIAKRSSPYYNRASFAVLFDSLRRRIDTDWASCGRMLIARLSSADPAAPISIHYLHEFIVYMMLLGGSDVRYGDILELPRSNVTLNNTLSAWRDVPPQLCVTVRVPRAKVRLFTDSRSERKVDKVLSCAISSRASGLTNSFCAIQVMFGQPKVEHKHGEPTLVIQEDPERWSGTSDVFISIFVPTVSLLMHDALPQVECSLMVTPLALQQYRNDLNFTLTFFETPVTSKNVFITRHMPGMHGLPQLSKRGTAQNPAASARNMHKISLQLSPNGKQLGSLTHRLSLLDEAHKKKLADRSSAVSVSFMSPLVASVAIGQAYKFTLNFPIPVLGAQYSMRIARKSSYIELEAPVWNPLDDCGGEFILPVMLVQHPTLHQQLPLLWTAARLNLDVLPRVDLSDPRDLTWVTAHGSMMMSTRERRLRRIGMAGTLPPGVENDVRVDLKDSIFSIFELYTGLQSSPKTLFGLGKVDVGIPDIVTLILPSSIRLDLVSNSVVIDAAVIPITRSMTSDWRAHVFLASTSKHGVMVIRVGDQAARGWKRLFPALAERCRSWAHGDACEYAEAQEVPPAEGLEDGRSPICSCGVGKFPAGYLKNDRLAELDYVLAKYATRMAISPIFPVPYVEDCFGKGLTDAHLDAEAPHPASPQPHRPAAPSAGGADDACKACGKPKAGDERLRVCAKCKAAKYCSRQCQRRDWKEHKKTCQDQATG